MQAVVGSKLKQLPVTWLPVINYGVTEKAWSSRAIGSGSQVWPFMIFIENKLFMMLKLKD